MTSIATLLLGDRASCRAEPRLSPQFCGLLESCTIPIAYINLGLWGLVFFFFALSTAPPLFPLHSPSHTRATLRYDTCSPVQNMYIVPPAAAADSALCPPCSPGPKKQNRPVQRRLPDAWLLTLQPAPPARSGDTRGGLKRSILGRLPKCC